MNHIPSQIFWEVFFSNATALRYLGLIKSSVEIVKQPVVDFQTIIPWRGTFFIYQPSRR